MFRLLELSNFRGFAEAKLAPLARVNLLTGLNGSGKTSILEAAFLISGAANASLVASLYGFRGESSYRVGGDRPFRSLFRNLDPSVTPQIVASSTELLKTSQRYRRELTIRPNYGVGQGAATTSPTTVLRGVTFDFVGPSGRFKSQWGWVQGSEQTATKPTKKSKARARQTALPPNTRVLLGGDPVKNPDLIKGHFVSPYVREVNPTDHEMLTQLIKERRLPEVVEALQLVNPALKNLQPLTEREESVIYADIEGHTLLPINLLGSGLLNCLRIVLPSLLNEDATILIDEFEDGLHHSLHGPLLEIVVSVAEKRRNQLFITTHSEEFLQRFISVMKERKENEVAFFRLGKIGLKGLVPRYTLSEAEDLLESNVDLR
jgi:predicted ATPase